MKKEVLEIKLNEEIKWAAENNQLFSQSQLEDICMFILNNSWDEKVLSALLLKPNIVTALAYALHNDEEFQECFEKRMHHLTLEYAKA
ncbi:MAG: hypothetical protein FWC96_02580 [Oscillospiraceae bacterium]|nr:hypothetical protein [Oscillospiraceae bacterium]